MHYGTGVLVHWVQWHTIVNEGQSAFAAGSSGKDRQESTQTWCLCHAGKSRLYSLRISRLNDCQKALAASHALLSTLSVA